MCIGTLVAGGEVLQAKVLVAHCVMINGSPALVFKHQGWQINHAVPRSALCKHKVMSWAVAFANCSCARADADLYSVDCQYALPPPPTYILKGILLHPVSRSVGQHYQHWAPSLT